MKRVQRCLLVLTLIISSHAYSAEKESKEANDKKSRYEKLELFNKVLYLIESQYYREVSTEKLIEGAINGMMTTLDPHSAFLDKEVFLKMQEETSGEFGGLGTSSIGKIALASHSDSHKAQSIHSSGSITKKFGPSWKQSTGHTSTQVVNLQLIQFSVTTNAITLTFLIFLINLTKIL